MWGRGKGKPSKRVTARRDASATPPGSDSSRSKFSLEALEPRILLSADPLLLGLTATQLFDHEANVDEPNVS